MASNLFKLSIEIGEEVGERKRRDVDKENENENEIENEGEAEAEEIQEESGKDNPDEKIRESNSRSRTQVVEASDRNLDPTAKVFKPSGTGSNRRRAMEDGERRSSPVSISKANPSTSASTSNQANASQGSGSTSSHPPKQIAGQKRDRSKVLLSVTREEGEASSENEAGAYEKEEGEEDEDSQPNPTSNDLGSLNVKDGERYISGGGSPMIRASSSGGNANGNGKGDGDGNLDFALPPAKRRK